MRERGQREWKAACRRSPDRRAVAAARFQLANARRRSGANCSTLLAPWVTEVDPGDRVSSLRDCKAVTSSATKPIDSSWPPSRIEPTRSQRPFAAAWTRCPECWLWLPPHQWPANLRHRVPGRNNRYRRACAADAGGSRSRKCTVSRSKKPLRNRRTPYFELPNLRARWLMTSSPTL